jgi:transcriptional regulator with XRE-family HTH domain
MNAIKSFREELGLTQQALGVFLSVSRGIIAKAETMRDLPTMAMIRMGQIDRALEQTPPVETNECAAAKKALLDYAFECEKAARQKREKLESLRVTHAKAVRLLSFTRYMLEQPQEPQLKAREIKLIKLWQNDALLRIETSGMAIQLPLERQVAVLDAEAAAATAQAAALGC